MKQPDRRLFPILSLLAVLAYVASIGHRDITTSHEARVVQTARLMARSWPWDGQTTTVDLSESTSPGSDRTASDPSVVREPVRVNPWLVPVMNGKIRLQKPPLAYWCAAVLFRLYDFGEGLARLVPALMGGAALTLVASLARSLYGRRTGWIAAGVWLGSYFVYSEYRKAMVDPYLAFFTLVAVWAWVRAASTSRRGRPMSWTLVLGFYGAIGLGVLAKGPAVLMTVLPPLIAYAWCFRRFPPGGWVRHLAGVGLLLLIALPWPLYILARVPHVGDIWSRESIGELTGEKTENARQWWYYLPSLLQISMPWTPLVVIGTIAALRRPRGAGEQGKSRRPSAIGRRRQWFPLAWLLLSTLAFTALSQKKNAYLLPTFPAMALLAAQGVVALSAMLRAGRIGSALAWMRVQSVFGIGGAVALAVVVRRSLDPAAVSVSTWLLLIAVVLLSTLPLVCLARVRKERSADRRRSLVRPWIVAQSAVFTAAAMTWTSVLDDGRENARSPRSECREVAAMVRHDPGVSINADQAAEEASVYLPLQMVAAPLGGRVLALVESSDRGERTGPPPMNQLRPFARGGTIAGVRPVPLSSGNGRWRLYELTIDRTRRDSSAADGS